MGYRLAVHNGDTVAVPRLIWQHLPADGDAVRVALYLIGGGARTPAPSPMTLG